MCHLVLLLPVVGILVFWLWPLEIALPVYLVILTVSALAYGAILSAMKSRVVTGREGLLHEVGEILGSSGDGWSVRVHGEIWHALSKDPLSPHDHVEVTSVEGLSLRVRKKDEGG